MTEQPNPANARGDFVFTPTQWATAGVGGLIGAALSLIVIFAAAALGLFPRLSDARIHDYLMAHPSLAIEMANKAQTDQIEEEDHERQAAVDKIGIRRYFSPAVAFVTGPANAKNSFVEFFDYNCAHCRNSFPVVQKFYNAHKGDTRFAFVDFPIFGEASTAAAQVAIAARRQGDRYIALHFLLMGEAGSVTTDALTSDAEKAGIDPVKLHTDLMDPEIGRTVIAAQKLAQDSLFTGTPTFIVNGKVHEGEITETELKQLLKR
ncbi:MAG: thioredoxin domain-containing protein [Rhizomicrobium sp.]|jgi:protein-disulfide isomerase